MPKQESVKKIVPVNELTSTQFTDVIELERKVTPDEEKRVDHIFVRRKKICKRNPSEIFSTEEISRFDIPWPEEAKKEIEEKVSEEQNIEINN
tara:strand:- start:17265 stop:17543 length:279 start_codon:yes stop_codon:yes gene_type:complete